ncbi:AAA family ATPase [Planotetraspora sp. A-T 1434]|uniref:BTAD domain-containing putative transcriptional regulator n=1 Tax=Planotetraspora sp. A-T 1434 TaxID=2979219 RepID=UPI0021BEA72B|nr:BTAD domain-containing putative transcriptional regulator [Planotetraspora sp. A-T 1434]MCT9929789.1 AAA family ATPase [Planotetraspora sp. A-T 1434]
MAEVMPVTATVEALPAPAALSRESGREGGAVDIRVLGPLEVVRDDGLQCEVGTPKQRILLAILVLAEGRPVSMATLIDRIWGDTPPAEARRSLHAYVCNLRRALEPGRPPRARSGLLTFGPAGYRLAVDPRRLDVTRFLGLVAEAEQATDPAAVERAATRALRLWRGEPYGDLAGQKYPTAATARLTEAKERVRELLVSAVIDQDRHHEVVGELEALTHEHPLRERLWVLRALALYRCGRQGEALDALRTARRILVDELGIDPGGEVRDLERDILLQSPHLRPARTHPTPVPAPCPTPAPAGPARAAGQEGAPTVQPREAGAGGRVMAGRREELAALDHLLDEVSAGRPGFALITGEPGIGKSRLAEEMAGRARERGHAVAIGRCPAAGKTPAFWPWTQLLRHLTGVTPLPAAQAGQTPPALGVAGVPDSRPIAGADPEEAEFRMYESAARLLVAAAGERPVLVILDDLHWADPSSLRLLSHLAQTFTEGRVAVIGTARDWPTPAGALAGAFEALARRQALRLPLTGLTVTELAELVAHGDTPEDDPRSLHDRTGGNPFFATELIGRKTACSARAVPPGVRDVVLGRISRLPRPTGDLLRLAATIGPEFDLALIARLAELSLDAALDRLEPAMAAALIAEGCPGRFRFAHAVVQETLTDGMPALRRAHLNAEIAQAITTQNSTTASNGAALTGRLRHPAAPTTNALRSAARRPDLVSRYHCRRSRGLG